MGCMYVTINKKSVRGHVSTKVRDGNFNDYTKEGSTYIGQYMCSGGYGLKTTGRLPSFHTIILQTLQLQSHQVSG